MRHALSCIINTNPSLSSIRSFSAAGWMHTVGELLRGLFMTNKKATGGHAPFDALIGELTTDVGEKTPLEICLSGDRNAIQAVPLRYRLIALGFVQHFSPGEVNERLIKNGCPRLYARSLREATLIYAFRNDLSYDEWKTLEAKCADLRTQVLSDNRSLTASVLSLSEIRFYVGDNSLREDDLSRTEHRTRFLSKELGTLPDDREKFREFLLSNMLSFSPVREKTRYYFCKYLLYYLETKKENYLRALRAGQKNAIRDHLSVFRIRTVLSRKRYDADEAADMIDESALSLGEIYRAFQAFYFESDSSDWLEIQLEYYGDLRSLSSSEKKALAAVIRKRDKAFRGLSDKEVINRYAELMEEKEMLEDAKYAQENKNKAYQTGRSGENFLRRVLRGELDLDRVTFLAFLLFFGKEARVPEEHRIDRERLDEILAECDYPLLDSGTDFDRFFLGFIGAKDPMMYLLTEAENMALSEENFYLYKTYLASESNEKRWQTLTET